MALRDQPYIPLYINDILTDEKLNNCSAASQGVFIKIMCILHKQENYGSILLTQKFKQSSNVCKNFASLLARHLPFTETEIYSAIEELVLERVLTIDGDKLFQKRMVHDGEVSLKRSNSGQQGVIAKANGKAKPKAKVKQNTEYETEYENVNEIESNNKKEVGEKANLETLFYPHDTPQYRESFAEMVKVRFKKKSQEQLQRMLDKVKNFDEQTGIDIFNDNFINDKWKGFIVKDSYLNRNGANLTPKPSPMDKILADAQAGMMISNNPFNG